MMTTWQRWGTDTTNLKFVPGSTRIRKSEPAGFANPAGAGGLRKECTMIKKIFVMTVAVLVMASLAMAKDIGGVSLPDSLAAGKSSLLLNGAGLRKKFFMKVYAGGLYLTQKNKDPKKVIAADEPMAIRMHFIYDGVSSKKLIAAWNEGFENGTGGNIAPVKEKIDTFNSFFKEEAKKGDIYDIIYVPGQGISVHIKEKLMGVIKGLDFKKAVFAIWLGEKPADKGLRKGMLGE